MSHMMFRWFSPVLIYVFMLVACFSPASANEERKASVTLEMKWQHGGAKQGDRVSLHLLKGSVDCSLNFFQSEDLQKYIESFGSATVPVTFNVSYRQNGKPSGALLVRVGEWEASRLQRNERLLSTTQKWERSQEPGGFKTLTIDSPGACFDPISSE
jgi:hypothetical protein